MTTGKVILGTVLAGTISIGVALFGDRWLDGDETVSIPLSIKGDRNIDYLDQLPAFELPDLSGRNIDSRTWAGKVLVLNFWATWCPPCLREIPLLVAARERHRQLQVVGIAIDSKEDVLRYLAEHPVNYPILLGETEAIEMSLRLGNRMQGLPFTVIFDHRGKRIHSQVGEITRISLSEQLKPLLSSSNGAQTADN